MLAFTQAGGREADPSFSVNQLAAGAEVKSCAFSEKSTAARTDTNTRITEASGERAGVVMADVHNRVIASASSKEQQAAGVVGANVVRSPALALDWWRNQRVHSDEDGGVAKVSHTYQIMTSETPRDMSSYGAGLCSPELKAAVSEEARWTECQLENLRLAQANTDPSITDFWGAVADKVNGRDSQQCQQKWFEHIATPQRRTQKTSRKCSPSHEPQAPINQQGDPGDIDDLFQATPMRTGRAFAGRPRTDGYAPKTPRTPAGPGAPGDDDTLVVKVAAEDGRAVQKRVVSKTYVQTMSKRIRKGTSQSAKGRGAAGGKLSTRMPSGAAGRTIHAADVSRGCRLKASLSSTGAVRVASICSGDEDSLELSDDEGNDVDERFD